MSLTRLQVRVPATSANLGPGFDCLALALDLWNTTTFTLTGRGVKVDVRGEGRGRVPEDARNLIARAFARVYELRGVPPPPDLLIECDNRIPLGSGMGSSAGAVLSGLLAADAFLGHPLTRADVLRLATGMEGHPDNAAAALEGGLVVVIRTAEGWLTRRYEAAPLRMAAATPQVNLPTAVARQALPKSVPLSDAVFNLGRTALVVQALREGDLALLSAVLDDRLHQPYRLKLIPGAEQALQAARDAGAAAAAISGAGPSLIAFCPADPQPVAAAMTAAFRAAGVNARPLLLGVSPVGAQIMEDVNPDR